MKMKLDKAEETKKTMRHKAEETKKMMRNKAEEKEAEVVVEVSKLLHSLAGPVKRLSTNT